MEQKTINQNKLQTLLCIIALTLGVLVSAVLFSMSPVHASNGFVDSIPESHKSFTYFCSNTFELYNEKNANGFVYPYTTREEKPFFYQMAFILLLFKKVIIKIPDIFIALLMHISFLKNLFNYFIMLTMKEFINMILSILMLLVYIF